MEALSYDSALAYLLRNAVPLYFIGGIIFWYGVVKKSMFEMAAQGDAPIAFSLHAARTGMLPMLIVKATVILFWLAFLIYGLATRCKMPASESGPVKTFHE